MKTEIFHSEGQIDLGNTKSHSQQLELDLQVRQAATAQIFRFEARRARVSDEDEVSRRLLDFAATLPDW